MECIHLIGSEEVSRAAHTMLSAANEMGAHVRNLTAGLEAHQRFLDDWLLRFQSIVEPKPPSEPPEPKLTEWGGGFAPVSDDTPVCVELRDGQVLYGNADAFEWRHYKRGGRQAKDRGTEVVAWRRA